MKSFLLSTVMAFAFMAPAYAETTAFHVGADSTGGAGTDPNLILSPSTAYVADNPNKAISSPLTLYFAVPDGEVAPILSSALYNGTTAKTITQQVSQQFPDYTAAAGKDFYTFIGCTTCNNSVNFVNMSAGEANDQPGVSPNPPTAYDVYSAVVDVAFGGKDYLKLIGAFADGTYIIPLANGFDTSFTNVGLITSDAIINPTVGGVPEPSTWLLGLTGFGLVAALGWKRKRSARYAIS